MGRHPWDPSQVLRNPCFQSLHQLKLRQDEEAGIETPTASMPMHTPEACDWPKAVQEFFAAEKKAVAEMDAHTPVTRRVRSADVTQLSLATSPLAWEFISKRVEAAESVAAAAVQKQVAGEKAAEK